MGKISKALWEKAKTAGENDKMWGNPKNENRTGLERQPKKGWAK